MGNGNTTPVMFLLVALFLIYLNNSRKLQKLKALLAGPSLIGKANSGGNSPESTTPVTGNGVDLAKRAAAEAGVPEAWASDPALWKLLYRESSTTPGQLNTQAQNSTSTAFGMFQFLDSTWKDYKYGKTSDAYKQFVNGLAYIKQRYGSPSAALKFHTLNNWY